MTNIFNLKNIFYSLRMRNKIGFIFDEYDSDKK